MNAIKKGILGAMLLSCTLFWGCTRVQQGAGIGAGAGALVGGIWASSGAGDLTAAEGAMVGAAGGGLVGALVGDALNKSDEDQLKAENANLKKQLAEKEAAGGKGLGDQAELAKLRALNKSQEDEIAKLKKDKETVTYTVLGDVLFASGSAKLTKKGMTALDEVAAKIKKEYGDREINVAGHTDNQPIKHSHWRSNWDLGAARGETVLTYLIKKHGLTPAKISETSFGEFRPVKENKTAVGRAENRRTDIIVLPKKD